MVKTQKEVPEKANVKMEIEIGEKISREGRAFCSGKALIPFAVFIVLYLGSGIFFTTTGGTVGILSVSGTLGGRGRDYCRFFYFAGTF